MEISAVTILIRMPGILTRNIQITNLLHPKENKHEQLSNEHLSAGIIKES
jgi:hypothetical protein